MTKNELFVGMATLLSALAEAPPGEGAPSGHLYAAMMGQFSLSEFLAAQAALIRGGLATMEGQILGLTPHGRETAAKVDVLLAKTVAKATA